MTHPALSPKVCIIPEFSDPECLDAQIHRVWEDYRKSRSKKQRRELAITIEHMKDEPSGIVAERHAEQGHGGLYELAEELTDEFETRYANFEWDGNFFDVIEDYIKEKRVVV